MTYLIFRKRELRFNGTDLIIVSKKESKIKNYQSSILYAFRQIQPVKEYTKIIHAYFKWPTSKIQSAIFKLMNIMF